MQLDETKSQFDQFWNTHERKMRQGLHLRQFEEDFKLVSAGHPPLSKPLPPVKPAYADGQSDCPDTACLKVVFT